MNSRTCFFFTEASPSWKRAGTTLASMDFFNRSTCAGAATRRFRIFVASGLHDLAMRSRNRNIFVTAEPQLEITLKNYTAGT